MDRRGFVASLASAAAAAGCGAMRIDGGRAARATADLESQMAAGCFDCAIAGGLDGPVAAVAAPGFSVDERSLFEVASVSKVFTAAICARLREQGRLDIDKPVFGGASARDLAAHVSGFTDAWMGRAGVYGAKWPFASDAEFEAAARAAKPSYRRREKCVYACTNAILLGFLAEDAFGGDLDAAARELVWGPLGMTATTWRNVPGDDPRLVRIYTKGPRPLGTKGDEVARNFARPSGNAGVFTSLADMRLFLRDLVERRTFGSSYYDLAFAPEFEGGGKRRSFGWEMSPSAVPEGWSRSAVCHSGYTGQYVAADPSDGGRAAIVFTGLKSEDPKVRSLSYLGRRRVAAIVG